MAIEFETDPTKIVDKLNEFLANIGPDLVNKIYPTNMEINNERYNAPLLTLQETNPDVVSKLLLKISSSKATGDYGIPVRFPKGNVQVTLGIIAHIINILMRTNQIPREWKCAVITPIFKERECNQPENYRPISILSCISKIIERIIHMQIYDHLNAPNL